jgi:signal transduction histidine kinase
MTIALHQAMRETQAKFFERSFANNLGVLILRLLTLEEERKRDEAIKNKPEGPQEEEEEKKTKVAREYHDFLSTDQVRY